MSNRTVQANPVQVHKGGCGPIFVEILVTCLTGGVLGGMGPAVAGKGSGSIVTSLLVFITAIGFAVYFGRLFVVPIVVAWLAFAAFKLLVDIIRSA